MFEVLIGVLGILIGLSAGMAAQLWIELKKVKVLQETLQADWNLRQIGGAVKLPIGYDPYRLNQDPIVHDTTTNGRFV